MADRSFVPGGPDIGSTRLTPGTGPRLRPSVGGPSELSATVVGFDGVLIGRITRHREAGSADSVLPQDVVVVCVEGDLDADTGPLLQTALIEALKTNSRVCCDLSLVTFFGAAGANVLSAAHVRATATGRHFTVRGARGFTRQVLAITGLDERLTSAQERTCP